MVQRNGFKEISYKLIKFSTPLIFSGILQQLYNWADAFIVGNVEGETALAAVGATNMAISFFLSIITGFTLGLSVLTARRFGAKEYEKIPRILKTFSVVTGGIFAVIAVAGICFSTPFLELLDTPADIIPYAVKYLQIIFVGLPFLAVYNVYTAALRGIGDSRIPFVSILVSSGLNVVLDIILVAGLHQGVAGAAVATAVSQVAMTIFTVIYGTKKHRHLQTNGIKMRFDREILKEGIQFGVPPMIQSGMSSLGGLVLQNFMNGFGTQTVAAITTSYRVDTLVLLPIINLGSGISTITAQNIGAGEVQRAKKVLCVGTVLMSVVSVALTVLVIPTGGRIIALFGISEGAVAIGTAFFQRIACFYLIFGLATALRGYLEGIGDLMYSSAAGILSLVIRIIGSYAMVSFTGNMVIAYAEMVSWVFLLGMYLIRVVYKMRMPAENK